jgi:hypothetical protein
MRCYCHESLLDIGCMLCGCLDEVDSQIVSEFLSCAKAHYPLGGKVALSTHEKFTNITTTTSLNFMQPLAHTVK